MAGLTYLDAFIHIITRDKDGAHTQARYFVEWLDGERKEYKNEKSAKNAIRYRYNKKGG
jgi:hypothetical protein